MKKLVREVRGIQFQVAGLGLALSIYIAGFLAETQMYVASSEALILELGIALACVLFVIGSLMQGWWWVSGILVIACIVHLGFAFA